MRYTFTAAWGQFLRSGIVVGGSSSTVWGTEDDMHIVIPGHYFIDSTQVLPWLRFSGSGFGIDGLGCRFFGFGFGFQASFPGYLCSVLQYEAGTSDSASYGQKSSRLLMQKVIRTSGQCERRDRGLQHMQTVGR